MENTEATPNYTDETIAKLSEMVENSTVFNFERAEQIGNTIGKSARSVIAKAKQLGFDNYVAKERPEPKGVIRKGVYVDEIESMLGVKVPTLVNTHKGDLVKLRDRLVAMTSES